MSAAGLTLRVEHLAANLDRLGRNQHESDDAGYGAAVDPIVDRASLHQHIAGLEMDGRTVELHVDLARHYDGVVDRVGAVIARARPWSELKNAEDHTIIQRCAGPAQPLILLADVVDRKALARPNDARGRTRAGRNEVLRDLINLNDGAAGCVVTGDNAAELQGHDGAPSLDNGTYRERNIQKAWRLSKSSGKPGPCSCASARSLISPKPSTGMNSSTHVAATCRGSRPAPISTCGSASSCGNTRCAMIPPNADVIASRCCAKKKPAAVHVTCTTPFGPATSSRFRCRATTFRSMRTPSDIC